MFTHGEYHNTGRTFLRRRDRSQCRALQTADSTEYRTSDSRRDGPVLCPAIQSPYREQQHLALRPSIFFLGVIWITSLTFGLGERVLLRQSQPLAMNVRRCIITQCRVMVDRYE